MRASVVLDNLLNKTPFLNSVISSRPPLPILAGILIEAKEGKIFFSATDLELGATTSAPAAVEETGRAVVPAKTFLEILTSMSEEKITIEKNEKEVRITGKRTRASMVIMDETEFPKLFEEKGDNIITLKKETAEKEILRVVFAAGADMGRPAFSAVMIKQDKSGFLMVATDSHRLSLNKTTSIKTKPGGLKKPILVSAKAIKAVVSQKNDDDIEVFVLEKNNQVVFSFGETTLVGRLIDAEYPDFEKIIPDGFSSKAEFDKHEMLNALKTTSIFARDNANIVRVSVKKDGLTVYARSQSLGENSVEIAAKTSGEENEIAFNLRYLLELLQNISEDQIVFEMQGPLNPGVFKIANDPNFIHLIMPIRVSEE